jgi:hypothetical protein
MQKINPKDKYIHKYKHDHINMFAIVRLFEGTRERRERKRE